MAKYNYNPNATAKQQSYLMYLLGENGYSTKYMTASFSRLGASCRQRSGMVADWVAGLTKAEASRLIGDLR